MASAEAPAGGRIDLATESYRADIRGLFAGLAKQAGARDAELLASQLQLIYDGASLSVRMDHDPDVAVAQRAAAAALVQAALRPEPVPSRCRTTWQTNGTICPVSSDQLAPIAMHRTVFECPYPHIERS